jgi:hypothetical protein
MYVKKKLLCARGGTAGYFPGIYLIRQWMATISWPTHARIRKMNKAESTKPMSLIVSSLCRYFANRGLQWRQDDFDAYMWVQAIKGNQLKGYAHVPVQGVRKRLNNQNLASAIDWFGTMAVQELARRKLAEPFLLIPVPNSGCVVDSSNPPRTRKLARAIVDELKDDSLVVDCLRWKENLGSASHGGGPRSPKILYNNLVVLKDRLKKIEIEGRTASARPQSMGSTIVEKSSDFTWPPMGTRTDS